MNGSYMRRYEMLMRVRDFGDAHQDLFPAAALAGQSFGVVRAAVADLAAHAATHESGRNATREGTTSKAAARDALREDLEAIVRTARAMAVGSPGLDDKFPQPRGGDQQLLNSARTFALDAAQLSARFVEYGLPEDFITDLQHDIADFEEAMRDQETGKGTKLAAAAAIDAAMDAAFDALVQLDALVPNRLRSDPGRLAMWERARRIEYPGRLQPEETSPVPGPSVSSATTPATT